MEEKNTVYYFFFLSFISFTFWTFPKTFLPQKNTFKFLFYTLLPKASHLL